MKKALRILVITLGMILLILILVPVVFKSKIESVVKEKINEEVQATVDWSSFRLSFFRGFPNLSINLHQVSVVGVGPFEGDTLAGLQRFELRVNPFGAIRKNIVVNSILVESPLINGIVLEDGTANWDIMQESPSVEPEEVSDQAGSSLTLSLKRMAFTGGRIYYLDHSTDMAASLEEFNLDLRGDLSMDQTDLKVSAGIDSVNVKMGGIPYLKDGVFSMELLIAANLLENSFTLKENLITLNGLTLGAEGQLFLLDEGAMDVDLKFVSKETSFKTLLSLVPAIYMKDFGSLKTSGSFQLDGTINGIMKDSILPNAIVNLQVKDGYFAYPGLPKDVSDVQVLFHLQYRGADVDASVVDLEQFHLLLGGNPFDLSMLVDHPVSDMHIAGRAKGMIDFASVKDIVPMETSSLQGRLDTDLRWDTRISYIEEERYEKVDLEGTLTIEGMRIENPEIPVPVLLEKMKMEFSPRLVNLETLDMKAGLSDLHMDGELENFIPYIFDGQTIAGRLNVSSTLLDANELATEERSVVVSDTIVPVPPDSLAVPASIRIPENVDITLSVDMKRVEYQKIVIQNLEGKIRVLEGVAGLDQLKMQLIDGSVTASGWVDTRGEFAETDVSMLMKDVDIATASETFLTLEKLMPIVKNCKGKATIDMEYHSFLDHSFAPLYQSINASGHANTKELQFYNLDDFISLSEVLKVEKFNEMVPDEVSVGFTVREGRVIFNPFSMDVYNSIIEFSGSHGFDLSMDYKLDMNIAKTDLGAGANQMIQGMTALAAGAGLRIPQSDYLKVIAQIKGTFNNPKLTTDLSGNMKSAAGSVQKAAEEMISQELEKVEEEAGEQAEKMISAAELEAARLVEEARKAGEELVREAENQGTKLVKEAGSNPLKQVAAKKAAGELKRQAEKQSLNLVDEAELKAAETIRKARDEAEKI